MSKEPIQSLLLIEDNLGDARLLREMLNDSGSHHIELGHVESMREAEKYLAEHAADMVLLDLGLPDAEGLEAVRRVRASAPRVPLVVLTGLDDESLAAQAMQEGAQDYLMKGQISTSGLLRAMRYASERKRAEARLQEYEKAVESLDEMILVLDREYRYVIANRAYLNYRNLTREELRGRPVRDFLENGFFDQFLKQKMDECFQGRVVKFETKITLFEKGEREISVSFFPIEGAAGIDRIVCVIQDITARKQSEEALRESEARFRSLVENATVGIYRTTPQGQILMANPALVRMLGYTNFSELCARNLESHGFETDHARRAFRDVIERDGEVKGLEAAWARCDGSMIFVRESARVVRDDSGTASYYDGVVEDISVRQQAERELLRVNRALKTISECNKAIVRATEEMPLLKDVCEIMVSAGGYRMVWVGYGEHDEGKSVRPVAQAGYEEGYLEKRGITWGENELGTGPTGTAIRTGKPFVIQYIQDDPRFAPWWEEAQHGGYASSIGLPLNVNNRVVGALVLHSEAPGAFDEEELLLLTGLANDVAFGVQNLRTRDERKQNDAERMRLLTAVEQSGEGMVVTDGAGVIQYVNPAFTVMTGYSAEEALGKNPRILKSGKHDAAFYADMWASILSGQVWRGEIINRRKDGSLYTEKMSITPVRSERGEMTHIVSMKEDITARKLLEDQFRQAQKMEAVGRLAAGVAHDFNNLLTIVIGYSDMMLEQFVAGDPRRSYVTEIKGAGERAVGLTRQLLSFSRQQVLAPQVLDISALIVNLTKLLKRLIAEDIDLVVMAAPSPTMIKADPGQIEQILMNLVVNARDAMPQGGKLTIETSHVEVDETYGALHFSVPAGRYALLTVTDTGCGMDKDVQAHIFEPFFTTKEQGKGTGLGLATVYGIVQQSGGYIWVYSEPGVGTTFKIHLPVVSGAPQMAQESAVAVGGSETVLLVEDDASLRGLARMVLESRGGYKVLESSGGKEARQFAGQHEGPIHLLLTDVVMPGMSGRQLSEELAINRPEMRILYMSGYTDDTVVRHGVLEEGLAFLQKPFAADSLLRKVRDVLDARLQA